MKRAPFPLQWPDGFPRTKPADRARSRFGHRGSGDVPFASARREMLDELSRLGAANVVVTSDLPTRNDGLPYANGRADDPGIAVWFVLANSKGSHDERVFPCDKWRSHAENMTAIARTVEAMRGMDRWGVGQVVERAFAGFAALPPGSSGSIDVAPVKRSWREVLKMRPSLATLPAADQLAIAKARHRGMISENHPDRGGSTEVAAELNAAIAEAEAELLNQEGDESCR